LIEFFLKLGEGRTREEKREREREQTLPQRWPESAAAAAAAADRQSAASEIIFRRGAKQRAKRLAEASE
jgi:hypothetical protein